MDPKDRPIEDLKAGDDFRKSLIGRADAHHGPAPLWYGWALMDAFLAGKDHERERCAKIAESHDQTTDLGDHIARAIRGVGQGGLDP